MKETWRRVIRECSVEASSDDGLDTPSPSHRNSFLPWCTRVGVWDGMETWGIQSDREGDTTSKQIVTFVLNSDGDVVIDSMMIYICSRLPFSYSSLLILFILIHIVYILCAWYLHETNEYLLYRPLMTFFIKTFSRRYSFVSSATVDERRTNFS